MTHEFNPSGLSADDIHGLYRLVNETFDEPHWRFLNGVNESTGVVTRGFGNLEVSLIYEASGNTSLRIGDGKFGEESVRTLDFVPVDVLRVSYHGEVVYQAGEINVRDNRIRKAYYAIKGAIDKRNAEVVDAVEKGKIYLGAVLDIEFEEDKR